MGFNEVFFGLYLGHNVDFFEDWSGSKEMNLVDYLKLIAKKVYVNTAGRRNTVSDVQWIEHWKELLS